MKFNFKLESVLKHRKTVEEIAQRDFFEAQDNLNKQVHTLKQMQKSIVDARLRAHNNEVSGGAKADTLRQIHEFIKGQEVRIQRQLVIITQAEKLVEEKREILRQKAIDYKIIDKIKEKQLESFVEEKNKKEQKQIDDIVVMRQAYKMTQG